MRVWPQRFFRRERGRAETRLVVLPELEGDRAEEALAGVADVRWDELTHAYGPAGDTPDQLTAITVGDDTTREAGWDALNGSILHQGTVYPATLPALRVLVGLAAWSGHPDRGLALVSVQHIAHTDDGAPDLVRDLRDTAEAHADAMVGDWAQAPEPVRRAQLLLLSALPAARARYPDLERTLPAEHGAAWAQLVAREWPEGDEAGDAIDALEGWAWGLLSEPG